VPHLHFGLTDTPDPLDSDSLPFVIDRMHLAGNATFAGDPVPTMTLTGTPANMRNTFRWTRRSSTSRPEPRAGRRYALAD
jgi:hypothetical protein